MPPNRWVGSTGGGICPSLRSGFPWASLYSLSVPPAWPPALRAESEIPPPAFGRPPPFRKGGGAEGPGGFHFQPEGLAARRLALKDCKVLPPGTPKGQMPPLVLPTHLDWRHLPGARDQLEPPSQPPAAIAGKGRTGPSRKGVPKGEAPLAAFSCLFGGSKRHTRGLAPRAEHK